MFEKVLVTNRGEITVRILHTCTGLGLGTMAVCSQADKNALHVQLADRSVCVGPAPSAKSCLNMNAILSTCEITRTDAMHPSVGFLSENAEFAERCEEQRACFIGPEAEVIRRMGDKVNIKRAVAAAGMPTILGSPGMIRGQREAEICAQRMGFPVLTKACAGGGGQEIRQVDCVDQLPGALAVTREGALRFFGYGDVYLEKELLSPRHVRVQILAGSFGNVVYLGEHDCSLQRWYQEVLEEYPSPSTALTDEVRRKMGEAAIRIARQVGYTGVGIVEFLLDHDDSFCFVKANTCTQVEHPITELV